MVAGQSATPSSNPVVPTLINFSGSLNGQDGKPLTSLAGVTFLLYADSQGGAPLWMEIQNVQPNRIGHYTVTLGSTTSQGLPTSVFASGEARWLGVQPEGQAEQPRVLLLSVPYALKAADAETVGGLPPSAFMLAPPPSASNASGSTNGSTATTAIPQAPPAGSVTGTGTANFVPLWTSTSNIGNSVVFQSGSGSTAKVGINTSTPASTLDVKGGGTVRGLLSLPATGTATATAGKNSQALSLAASSFSSSTSKAVTQTFQWQAEPTSNNTATPAGTLNLLFGSGSSKAAETGLNIASNGQITFAPGQTFPGTGNGTITGVTAGSDLTGGGTTGTVTLNLDTTKVPQLATANTFVGNQSVAGILSVASSAYQPVSVQSSSSFGTWLALGNSSTDGHTWNIISAGGGNAEGAGNLGITDLTGTSTIWLEGNTNVSGTLVASSQSGTAQAAVIGNGYVPPAGSGNEGVNGIYGVGGNGDSGAYGGVGVEGVGGNINGSGGLFVGAAGGTTGDGIVAVPGSTAYAGYFGGGVYVDGNLFKLGGSFKIDHPLDPANKYLSHSFVESPDMMNIYNGNVVTDSTGDAVVLLPEWFETLNRDFRYQLTVIGQFAQAIVTGEVANHEFSIKTDKPGVKVSWQVTGIRQDPWANAHRIPVEEEKDARERGHYIRPELYGAPEEASIAWARHPETMKRIKEMRRQQSLPHVSTANKSGPTAPKTR